METGEMLLSVLSPGMCRRGLCVCVDSGAVGGPRLSQSCLIPKMGSLWGALLTGPLAPTCWRHQRHAEKEYVLDREGQSV